MIKFVYVARRRPDISPEAFRKYWLENHGPLVRSFAQTMRAKTLCAKPHTGYSPEPDWPTN